MTRTRILIIALIGIVGIISAVAYSVYNKPHRDIAHEKAMFILTSDELFDDYELNETTANEKYLDAVVEVTGKIESIDENNEGRKVLTMTASNAMLGGVSATLIQTNSSPTYTEGQEVTVKCRCTGKLMDVVLVDCNLITR